MAKNRRRNHVWSGGVAKISEKSVTASMKQAMTRQSENIGGIKRHRHREQRRKWRIKRKAA